MKKLARALWVLGVAPAMVVASSAQATLYSVNRSFGTATLTGILDIPVGNYTIQNESASPFSSVSLTLTVNGFPWELTHVLTDDIRGLGRFFIDASPASLTFSTANGDGSNPADLVFSDLDTSTHNRYVIGSDGSPGFEAAYTHSGDAVVGAVFPIVFATAIPEPGTVTLLALGLIALGAARRTVAPRPSRDPAG